jgi:hypothetical protein
MREKTAWLEEVKTSIIDYRMSLSSSRHAAAKQMHYKVGVGLMVKFANYPFLLKAEH